MYFDAVTNTRIVVATCERAGIAVPRLFFEAGIPEGRTLPPALHVRWDDLRCLLEAGERLTGDPAFCLHADAAALAPRWGVIGQYVLAQRTMREAVSEGLRMAGVITNIVHFELIEQEGKGLLRTHWHLTAPAVRHLADLYLLMQMVSNRHMSSQSWCARELRLRDRPVRPEEYQRIFGCPVRMGFEWDEMVVDSAQLDEPRYTYDPQTVALLRPHFDTTLAAMSQNLGTTLWILSHLETGLLTGTLPTLAELARQIHTSVRTLTARLSAEHTSYRVILEGVRSRHAQMLLRHSDSKVESIANLLGYTSPATFVRAFRRWTGMTPAAWRSKCSVGPTNHSPG